MSKKIEINTLITKHENKYKDCRFDLIDVEDPLWEYGNPLKRVLIDNQTGETYDSVSKLVGLLNSLDNELEESSAFIIEQREENKQLKAKASSWKITCSQEMNEKADLMKQLVSLTEENEQLKSVVKQLYFKTDDKFLNADFISEIERLCNE